jgi:hypothetical protein
MVKDKEIEMAALITKRCVVLFIVVTCAVFFGVAIYKNDPMIYSVVLPAVSWIVGFAAGKN